MAAYVRRCQATLRRATTTPPALRPSVARLVLTLSGKPFTIARGRCATVTYEPLTRSCSRRWYVTSAGAGGLRSAPRRGPPADSLRDRCRFGWDVRRLRRWDGAPRGWPTIPMAWASAPGHRQQVSMATAAREQHEVRGRHLGCTTLTRTAHASRPLRLAGPSRTCWTWTRLAATPSRATTAAAPRPETTSSLAPAAAGGNARVAAPAVKRARRRRPATRGSPTKLSSSPPRPVSSAGGSLRVRPTDRG
jgi:hypothetical protein